MAQALEALRKLRAEKTAEVKEFRLRLDHLRTHKDTAARLRADAAAGKRQEAEHADTIRHIDAQLAEITKARCICSGCSACPSQLSLHKDVVVGLCKEQAEYRSKLCCHQPGAPLVISFRH